MFDKDAIKELTKAEAISSANSALTTQIDTLVTLPEEFKVHDLEKYMSNRRRARGTMDTSVIEDFAKYVKAHAENGASVFIDQDHMAAVAVLNLGEPESPGQADNLARLTAKRTAAYGALRAIATGTAHKQTTIADFFEDWAGYFRFYSDEGEITAPKAIAAVRNITIEAMRKQQNEERQLGASKSAFESIQATSVESIPTTIYFTTEPFNGLASRLFVMRLAIITSADKPAISLRIVKQEQHDEDMAKELASLVRAAVEIPVLIGKYATAA